MPAEIIIKAAEVAGKVAEISAKAGAEAAKKIETVEKMKKFEKIAKAAEKFGDGAKKAEKIDNVVDTVTSEKNSDSGVNIAKNMVFSGANHLQDAVQNKINSTKLPQSVSEKGSSMEVPKIGDIAKVAEVATSEKDSSWGMNMLKSSLNELLDKMDSKKSNFENPAQNDVTNLKMESNKEKLHKSNIPSDGDFTDAKKPNLKDTETENLYSTNQERLNRTPKENGTWTGQRGESKFISDNDEVNKYLREVNIDGIFYKNAMPDFSKCSKGDVEISNMTDQREGLNGNFNKANIELAKQKGCTPREVRDWMRENGYTWHECNDLKTCQKIPSIVNKTFGHLGGVGEYKRKIDEINKLSTGGIFDV